MNTKRVPTMALLSTLFVLVSCTSDESGPPKSTVRSPPRAAPAPVASSAPAPAVKAQPPAQAQPPARASAPAQPVSAVAPTPPAAATTTPEDPELSSMDLGVPSQEEADLEAEQSIDADNADAALEELEQELEGGGR